MDGTDKRLLNSIVPGIGAVFGALALVGTWTNGVSYALGSGTAFAVPLAAAIGVIGSIVSILLIKASSLKLAQTWAQ